MSPTKSCNASYIPQPAIMHGRLPACVLISACKPMMHHTQTWIANPGSVHSYS